MPIRIGKHKVSRGVHGKRFSRSATAGAFSGKPGKSKPRPLRNLVKATFNPTKAKHT